jgi:hypothetical protein
MSKTNFCVKIVYKYYCFNIVIIVFIIQLFFTEQSVPARSSCLPVSFVFSILVLLLIILQKLCFLCLSYTVWYTVLVFHWLLLLHPPPFHAANKSSREMVWILFSLWHCRPPQIYWFCLFQMSLSRGLSLLNGKCGSYVKLQGKPWLQRLPLQVNPNLKGLDEVTEL